VVLDFLGVLLQGTARAGPANAPDPDGIDLFEMKIRAILADRCAKCHSTRTVKIKAGLLLDNLDSMLKGSTSGPALIQRGARRPAVE
jgi:hypothetical protein